MCETDEFRLQLLRLWEDSLYLEFSESRQDSSGGSSPAALSSSMRYKLRKKFPCPVELDQELRVKNARLPKPVHDGLNDWLKENRENPYPNKRQKESLASRLGITPQQVRACSDLQILGSRTCVDVRPSPLCLPAPSRVGADGDLTVNLIDTLSVVYHNVSVVVRVP